MMTRLSWKRKRKNQGEKPLVSKAYRGTCREPIKKKKKDEERNFEKGSLTTVLDGD